MSEENDLSRENPGPTENFGSFPVSDTPINEQQNYYAQNPYTDNRYEQPQPPPPTRPLPLGEAIKQLFGQYKLVLMRPKKEVYEEQISKAGWNIVAVQIALQTATVFLTYLVMGQAFKTFMLMITPKTMNGSSTVAMESTKAIETMFQGPFLLILALTAVVFTPLSIFIVNGVQYGMAKVFKGQGGFLAQTYTYLLHATPIAIISSLAFVPMLIHPIVGIITGILISMPLGFYTWYLNIIQIQATHRFSINRAVGTVFIPYAVLYGLYLIIYIAFFVLGFLAGISRLS